jgi:hypothetical protein
MEEKIKVILRKYMVAWGTVMVNFLIRDIDKMVKEISDLLKQEATNGNKK